MELDVFEYVRGHLAGETQNGNFVYADTYEPCKDNRPCIKCNKFPTFKGYDACLGTLDGVKFACCGHGRIDNAYIMFNDGKLLEGQKAISYFKVVASKKSNTQFTRLLYHAKLVK